MKKISLSVAILLVAGGLVADPLFCCTLPAGDHLASFSAPAMDCCPEGALPGCSPKLEKPPSLAPVTVASATSVFTTAAVLAVPFEVSLPGRTASPAPAPVERPPRLHLLYSQFRT
jgi:hypothetical protein